MAALMLPLAVAWIAASPTLRAADYYIDPSGNDANSGTTSAQPWKTLGKVNGTVFQPGDNIYFKRGGTWYGSLTPQGSGNSTSQITLSSYGTGAKPLIDGGGNWAVIALSNQEYWTIDGFEVTNPATGDSGRSGIRIDASGSQTTHRIRILNNDVRDIRGIRNVNNGARNCGGIFVWINEPGNADDVLIQGNTVTNVYGQGINFAAEAEYMGGGMNYSNCSPNVVVRGNTVMTTSGDGILLLGTDNELAEYNEVGYCGALSDDGNNIAAAWPTRHVNGVWQYNYIHDTVDRGNDSTAFDNDGFVKGTTYFQYNQTYNNQGGFFMEYQWGGDSNAKSVVRYNISVNDSRVVATNRAGALFYNNVFYNPDGSFGAEWTSAGVNTIFYNNIFWGTGYWGTFASQAFSYNTFYGGMGALGTFSASRDPRFVNPNTSGDMAGFILASNSLEKNSGLAISNNGGKDFWGASVPASTTAPHRGASQINSTASYTATPTYLTVSGESFSASIPTSGSNSVTFQAVVRDQYFRVIPAPSVSWSLSPAASGYAIDANGVLTISSGASPQRLAVVATSGTLSNSFSITAASAPADSIWTQPAGGNWSAPANWQNNTIANGADMTATFNLAGSIAVNQDLVGLAIGNFSFANGNYTLTGNSLALDTTSGTPSIAVASGSSANIASVITGNDGLTKADGGTLQLSGTNIYTGGTTVSGGTLSLVGGQLYSNLGWGDQTVRVQNGAVLEVDRWDGGGSLGQLGYNQSNLVIDGGTIRYVGNTNRTDEGPGFTIGAGGATLEADSPAGQIWNINKDPRSASFGIASNDGGTLTLAGSGNGIVSKVIPGNGGLVKSGSGTWTLTNNNTYSGSTTINAGTLVLSPGDTDVTLPLPAGNKISGNGSLLANAGNILLSGDITLGGSQSHIQAGSTGYYRGIKVLDDTNLTASSIIIRGDLGREGATDKNLVLNTSAVDGTITLDNVNIGRSGILYALQSFTANAGNGIVQITGLPCVWSSTPVALTGSVNISADLTVSNPLAIHSTVDGSVSGVLTATGGLTKSGAGILTCSGNDLTAGDVAVNRGTLLIDVPESHVVMSSTTVGNGAKLQLNRNGTTGAADPNWWSNRMGLITVNQGGILETNHAVAQGINQGLVINGGSISSVGEPSSDWGHFTLNSNVTVGGNANSTITATIALNGSPSFDVAGGSSLTVSGPFINRYQTNSGFTKTGSGTISLNATNSYTGNTTVNGGTLRLGDGSSSTNLADNADLIVAPGAMLELDFSGTDVIDELWVDGNRMPVGVYSTTSGFITGSGTLTVTNGPATGNYLVWSGRGGYDLSSGPDDDEDADGIANLMEYILGGNPRLSSGGSLPTATTQTGNLVFTFRRVRSSTADTTQTFQYGTSLTTWIDVPIVHGGMVSIAADTPVPGMDSVTVIIPGNTESWLFGRLKVSIP